MITFNTQGYLNNLEAAANREFDYRKGLLADDWILWQEQFRKRLCSVTGLDIIRNTTGRNIPLKPRIVEKLKFNNHTQEKIYIQTETGIEIPFYLLLPKQQSGNKLPLVIAPHGHGKQGKEVYVGQYGQMTEDQMVESVSGDRDIGVQALKENYAVICPDQRGFWEMSREEEFNDSNMNNSCLDLQRKAMMYGRSLIGERVHDMGRLLDYAATRVEIDTTRIVITGNSGGGTTALFAAAMDERYKICIPGSYFCTFNRSILPIRHCFCNVIPGIMHLAEMHDIVALIAPKPILFVNGKKDQIYPIEGAREGFLHVKELYRSLGFDEGCELYEGDGGHRYYKDRVWSFIKEHI